MLLPKLGDYEIVEEVVDLKDGARLTSLVRRYKHVEEDTELEREPLLGL